MQQVRHDVPFVRAIMSFRARGRATWRVGSYDGLTFNPPPWSLTCIRCGESCLLWGGGCTDDHRIFLTVIAPRKEAVDQDRPKAVWKDPTRTMEMMKKSVDKPS